MIINNYFHENNSATTASLIIEQTLRAVVDCVFCTRKAYYLHREIISKMYLIENKEVTLLYKLNR